MKKRLENLVEKFKSKEAEILEILKQNNAPVFDESLDKALVKKSIKDYIKKVNKAAKLFDEYEALAKEISDITGDEGESAELSKAVVEFREDEFVLPETESKSEKKDEKKKPKTSKKTKQEKESVKEL